MTPETRTVKQAKGMGPLHHTAAEPCRVRAHARAGPARLNGKVYRLRLRFFGSSLSVADDQRSTGFGDG